VRVRADRRKVDEPTWKGMGKPILTVVIGGTIAIIALMAAGHLVGLVFGAISTWVTP